MLLRRFWPSYRIAPWLSSGGEKKHLDEQNDDENDDNDGEDAAAVAAAADDDDKKDDRLEGARFTRFKISEASLKNTQGDIEC